MGMTHTDIELSGSYWIWCEESGRYGDHSLLNMQVVDGNQPRPHESARLYVPAARWLPGGAMHAEWPMEGD